MQLRARDVPLPRLECLHRFDSVPGPVGTNEEEVSGGREWEVRERGRGGDLHGGFGLVGEVDVGLGWKVEPLFCLDGRKIAQAVQSETRSRPDSDAHLVPMPIGLVVEAGACWSWSWIVDGGLLV